jgi:hypothetical protein
MHANELHGWLLALFGLSAMLICVRNALQSGHWRPQHLPVEPGRSMAMATDPRLPLASFTESSGFSVCSYPSAGTGLFQPLVA